MRAVKKVLFVCSVYKPNVGGIETTIEKFSEYLHFRGIKCFVLTKRFPYDLPEKERLGYVTVFRLNRPRSDGEFLSSIEFLKKHEKSIKSDIVHTIGIRRPMPLYALLLARKWKVPLITTFAGGDLPDREEPNAVKIWSEGKSTVPDAVAQSDAFISYSKYLSILSKKTLKIKKRVNVIYAGIDIDGIGKIKPVSIKKPFLFSARRLDKSKGLDILIRAYFKEKERLKNVKLLIAGDGEEKSHLSALVRKLNLGRQIEFLGNLSQTKVISYMCASSASICPSRTEGGGIVNLEAQASGTLAIGSDAGGIPEYINNGVTGLVYHKDDVYELSRLLVFAVENSTKKIDMLDQAKNNIKKYSWENFSKSNLEIYNNSDHASNNKQFRSWSDLTAKMWARMNNE